MIAVATQRRRPGRPSIATRRKRVFSIYLRLTDKELALIRWRAGIVGVRASCLARDLALYAATPILRVRPISPVAIGRLARIGNLLNQAMHRINAGRLAPEIRPIFEELDALLAGLLRSAEVEPE